MPVVELMSHIALVCAYLPVRSGFAITSADGEWSAKKALGDQICKWLKLHVLLLSP